MKERSLVAVILILPVFMSLAQVPDPPAFERHLYLSGNDTLPYRLLKPQAIEADRTYPLIVFFHGASERGKNNFIHLRHIASLFMDTANRRNYPCFVVAPQCPPRQWWSNITGGKLQISPSRPMQLAIELIATLEKKYAIDQKRIYIAGLSMGGYGVWDILARYPDRFAAAVPICGGGDVNTASRIGPVPVWAFHGAKDNIVPVDQSRKMIDALRKAGGNPKYTEYEDAAHDSWSGAFKDPDLIPWLFSQKISNQKKLNN